MRCRPQRSTSYRTSNTFRMSKKGSLYDTRIFVLRTQTWMTHSERSQKKVALLFNDVYKNKTSDLKNCARGSRAWKVRSLEPNLIPYVINQGWRLRGWEFAPFANFSLFNLRNFPKVSIISVPNSRENCFLPKRPKIAKPTKHRTLPKQDAIFIDFP